MMIIAAWDRSGVPTAHGLITVDKKAVAYMIEYIKT